ncbi:HlyC/CorC family transporter [Candidatus Micrarchaeota archaeon]|nr:HlyC/CorC family transporter [Candidatus Micrarchaeota archaeon]
MIQEILLELLLFAVLITLSAFFSGSEVALVSVDKVDLRKLSKQRVKGIKTLRELKRRPKRMLTTILIGNNFVNIFASATATAVAIQYFGSLGIGIATGVMTFLVLVFGEIFPKTYSSANPVKVSLFSAPVILFLSKLFSPIILLFEIIPDFLTKHILKSKSAVKKVTEDDIVSVAEIGVEDKAIEPREKELIETILEFGDVRVRDVMVPKEKMIMLNAKSTVSRALKLVYTEGHSRYPVYEGRKSNITGIVHIKEMLKAIHERQRRLRINHLMIQTIYAPENAKIDSLLKEMQKKHIHMAMVVNKKGKISGLITLEDIIEEILGEIHDEEDTLRALGLTKI